MKGCMSCIKYCFFFFNFLFWVLGALGLGVGIWAVVDAGFETQVKDALASVDDLNILALKQAAYLMIIAGAIMMVIGFFGCFGAIRESQCLLIGFFVLLLLVLTLCIAIIAIVFANPHLTDSVAKPIFDRMVASYAPNNNSSLDLIQKTLKCCGAEGPEDFTKQSKAVPATCSDYKEGCVHALHTRLENSFEQYPVETGAVTAAILVIIVIGMVLSLTLCCVIRQSYQPDRDFKVV